MSSRSEPQSRSENGHTRHTDHPWAVPFIPQSVRCCAAILPERGNVRCRAYRSHSLSLGLTRLWACAAEFAAHGVDLNGKPGDSYLARPPRYSIDPLQGWCIITAMVAGQLRSGVMAGSACSCRKLILQPGSGLNNPQPTVISPHSYITSRFAPPLLVTVPAPPGGQTVPEVLGKIR